MPGLRTLVTTAGLATVLLIVAVLAAPLAPPLQAQSTETTVPASWNLKPSGLAAGDKFRLLIVTSTTRNAESTAISDYDTHVQNAVASANGHPDIRSHSSGFKVLGSTETVNARDHTETRTTDTSVPIYYLNGEKVADDYTDLYDGSWDSDVPRDESGEEIGEVGYYVEESTPTAWTGTENDGTTDLDGALASTMSVSSAYSAAYGVPRNPGGQIRSNKNGLHLLYSLYGLSGVFVVGSGTSTSSTTFISNTSANSSGSSVSFTAQGFETGSAGSYTVTEVDIYLGTVATGASTSVSIRENNADDEPGALVGTTLTNPASLTSNSLNTFTHSGITLAASTTYWVSVGDGISNRAPVGRVAISTTTTGETGWSLVGGRHYRGTATGLWTTSSTTVLLMAVKGTSGGTTSSTDATLDSV